MPKPTKEQVKEWVRDSNHNEPMFYQVACAAAEWGYQQSKVKKEEISEEENDRRFKECMKAIENLKPGEITELMGKEFMEEFRRVSQR
jgi:hypothetical protein